MTPPEAPAAPDSRSIQNSGSIENNGAIQNSHAIPDRHAPGAAGEAGHGPLAWLQRQLDRLLVLDVFLVIGGALWFAIAVVLHGQGLEAPLRLFQRLWQPLFTPAISLLMAAALLSGALGWWRRRGQR